MSDAKQSEKLKQAADQRARRAYEAPPVQISFELAGERAAILAAIRRPQETAERTILRLIDAARPASLDVGTPV